MPTSPTDDIDELLSGLAVRGQLVHVEHLPARPARHEALRRAVPDALAERLPGAGLWTHQAQAIDLVRGGTDVAVATGTASGKSLCYQVPIAEAVLDGTATALLVYPTKALAQDQLRAMAALEVPGLVAATYDGDTEASARTWVRRHATAVLTNPDMLHVGILPNHARWATFLKRLRYVVLDELHTLRGVFGTHVGHVVRRLRRLCAHYGSDPTFIVGSATIGDPARLASSIVGRPVVAVDDDGSPQGERVVALWQPPLLDEAEGTRASSTAEAATLLAGLVAGGRRTIAFTRSRRSAELIAAGARRRLPDDLASRVRPYRGGYLPSERREIEAELFDGRLLGVSTTTALELGVDVGTLDACVVHGFPGTIASFRQQIGRVGRARQTSLAVLVAGDDALDQWFARHPRELFARPPEPAVVNPSNPFVLDPHVACAAYERPVEPADETWWGDDLDDAVRRLVVTEQLKVRDGRAVHAARGRPAARVSLRSSGAGEVAVVDAGGRLVGTVEGARAPGTVHPGAIYLHQGQHLRVTRLDLDDGAAWVERVDPTEFTQSRSTTDVSLLGQDRTARLGPVAVAVGPVEVVEQVTGYRRRAIGSGDVIEDVALDLPPTTLVTRACWYTIPPAVLAAAGVTAAAAPGALHAAEHAAIGVLPLFTICDRWDVGGVSTAFLADTGAPTIVIYDGYPGGAGVAELAFDAVADHLRATLEVIDACPCEAGCPSCVQSPKCGNLNEPLDKHGAAELLRRMLPTTGRRR